MRFGEHFIIERRGKGEKKRSRTHRAAVTGLAVILAVLLCAGCGTAEQAPAVSAQAPTTTAAPAAATSAAPETTPASAVSETAVPETAEPESVPLSAGEKYLADAREYFDEGEYYLAYDAAVKCQNEADADLSARSEELIEQIKSAVSENEPENGEELERTFSVSGGGQFRVTAQSGPLEMLVTDNGNPKQYVRFYVRHGETGNVYLPGGSYTVTCKLGYIWFDDETGFGEYYDYLALEEPLVYEFSMTGGWVSNSIWSLTI